MKKQPLFSIIIPAYKRKFLKECIESILAQTYENFELVIVNDASPEDLDSVVFSHTDSRIRYYTNEKNCGALKIVDNWNICLSYATGQYVICMGDDDKLLPNCLEEYMRLIDIYPGLGVYHAWTEIIDESSKVIRMQEARPVYESVYSMIWHRWNGRSQYIGDFLFDADLLLRNGGFYYVPMAWASDDISAVIAAKDTGVANSQIPLFQYRVNSQTISNIGNIGVKLDAIKIEEKWFGDFLNSSFCDEKDTISCTYLSMCRNSFNSAMAKRRIFSLKSDFVKGKMLKKAFFWIRNRKRYNLNFKIVIYSLIEAVKYIKVHG